MSGGKRKAKHFIDTCKRCGKGITEKNKSIYHFLCKGCLKTINRKLAVGGKRRKIYSPSEMLEILRLEISDKLSKEALDRYLGK